MKRYLISAAALALLPMSAATAADIPFEPAPIEAPVPDMRDWSGFYIGVHGGYGFGDFEFRDPFLTINAPGLGIPGIILGIPLEREFEGDGFLGGAQAGVNAQFGSVVVGIEGDISATGIEGDFRSSTAFGPFTTDEGVSAELEWLATFRGRLGWAFDRFLAYGTGGVAVGGIDASGDASLLLAGVPLLTLEASDDQTHVGWTAGVGGEAMLTDHVSAKLEYLFTDLGWEQHEGDAVIGGLLAPIIPPGIDIDAAGDFKLEIHSIKAGLNYRF